MTNMVKRPRWERERGRESISLVFSVFSLTAFAFVRAPLVRGHRRFHRHRAYVYRTKFSGKFHGIISASVRFCSHSWFTRSFPESRFYFRQGVFANEAFPRTLKIMRISTRRERVNPTAGTGQLAGRYSFPTVLFLRNKWRLGGASDGWKCIFQRQRSLVSGSFSLAPSVFFSFCFLSRLTPPPPAYYVGSLGAS